MNEPALKIDELTEKPPAGPISPDLAPPPSLTVKGSGDEGGTPPDSPDPPLLVPPTKKKRGGKRKGAGRPKKSKEAASPFQAPKKEEEPASDVTAPLSMLADMDHVAAVGAAALDGLIVGVAKMRHGEKAESLHASKKALGDIQGAMVVWLKHTALMVTPGQALLVAIAATYAPPMIALEMEKRGKK